MLLTPMRYKDYIWPHNPATYSITYERQVAVHKRLRCSMIHPLWQIANAYFTGLKLEQEPLPDYVRYSFEFRERYDGYREELSAAEKAGEVPLHAFAAGREQSCTVAGGDTLWGIAKRYDVAMEKLLRANPGIKNPNLVRIGDRVVIPC